MFNFSLLFIFSDAQESYRRFGFIGFFKARQNFQPRMAHAISPFSTYNSQLATHIALFG